MKTNAGRASGARPAFASSFILHPSSFPRRGYTLVEMLATVAVLVIVLGLMVSLARHVRERSAQALTTDLLRQLDAMMTAYAARHDRAVPAVPPFPPPDAANVVLRRGGPDSPVALEPRADRQVLLKAAEANNAKLVAALRTDAGRGPDPLAVLPVSAYDGASVRDAWGSPIVFMETGHPWVGTARRDRAHFFFSAGPDRDYLTLPDNLYSYEATAAGE